MFIIKYLKSILYVFLSILFLGLIISTLSYFKILGNGPMKVLEIIILSISCFIGGLYLGNNSQKKGYLEGIKIGLFMCVFLYCLNIFGFKEQLNISSLIFCIIILVSSILGSIIGINKKGSRL